MFKIFMLISLFFLHYSSAKVLKINLSSQYETNGYFQYTLAQEANESIDKLNQRIWTADKKTFNTFKYANHAYWAKINIYNTSNKNQTYYFKAENQFTYKIDYYVVQNKKIIEHIEDGVISKNHHREFNTNHMIFPLLIEKDSQVTVYFKIRNYNKVNIDFTLVSKKYLVNYYQTYNLLEGIFFGGMLLMMLYNLFLYFLLHSRAYIYYVAYVFSLSVYFIGVFGFSERYFSEYTYLFYLSSGAFFVFLTLFVQAILGLKEKLPTIHKILNFFILYFILSTLVNIYILDRELFFYAQLLFNVFFILVFIFVSVIIGSTYYLAYVKHDSIAKFYAVVWSAIALIGLLLPLQYLNFIKIEIASDYIFQFLILVEVLLFSFILAYKINLIEKEKKAQEELLVQQNKLASMGEVIGMIAHQWRQPLSQINGIILNMDIDYQKKQLPKETFNTYLDEIEKTTAYMSQTVNDFIDYFQHNKNKEEFKVSELIDGTLNLVSSSNKKAIQINYIEHPPITLFSYRSELVQALLIVINNALDACSANYHEKLEVTISVNSTHEHIIISIKDNGGGIPLNIQNKIYDPYFTTKHKSQGTGLGLYILKMIIEQTMQGKIDINSSNGVTKCDILIPITVTVKNTI